MCPMVFPLFETVAIPILSPKEIKISMNNYKVVLDEYLKFQ